MRITGDDNRARLSFVVGGRWFCPGCASALVEHDGLLSCPTCGACVNRFVGSLVELYVHPAVPIETDSNAVNPLLRAAMYGATEVARSIWRHSPAMRSVRGANSESAAELALAAGHCATAVALFHVESSELPPGRDPAASLKRLMYELSEGIACAGWLTDLEHILWHVAHSADPIPERVDHPGFSELDQAARDDLPWLSDLCGGWFRYGEHGPELVSVAAWSVSHEVWVRRLPTPD